MESVKSRVEELVSYIQNTKEYQNCIQIREKMKNNLELQKLIEEIKDNQKKYIRSGYDTRIKEHLDSLEKQLEDIPIYSVYLENLERVNEMISYVQERLNDYFTNMMNS